MSNTTPAVEVSDVELETSLITFGEEILGFNFYDWQADTIEPFDDLSLGLVMTSLRTPNGSGKSAVVIPTLVLGLLSLYPRAKIVLTTADGKQLDGQVMPAIEAHRAKFPTWKFIEREILTPGPSGGYEDGGRFVAFTTDDAGRAEGWHKLNDHEGPLIIIVDEAKTVPDAIFDAIDRCTYNALLYTSSPGRMKGRFYESQTKKDLGFRVVRVGLLDCPHIGQDKIDRIIKIHGADSPFTRSTLHGEFMQQDEASRFDEAGLAEINSQVLLNKHRVTYGVLVTQKKGEVPVFIETEKAEAWLQIWEEPEEGLSYIAAADFMRGEQAGAAKGETDCHTIGVGRAGYTDSDRADHLPMLAAALLEDDRTKDIDLIVERIALMCAYYGNCPAAPEINLHGDGVVSLLKTAGVTVWERRRKTPSGSYLMIPGFDMNASTKRQIVNTLAAAVREKAFILFCERAYQELCAFITHEDGSEGAVEGMHDDWVVMLAILCHVMPAAKIYEKPKPPVVRDRREPRKPGKW